MCANVQVCKCASVHAQFEVGNLVEVGFLWFIVGLLVDSLSVGVDLTVLHDYLDPSMAERACYGNQRGTRDW